MKTWNPLHSLLILSETPNRWPTWQVAALLVVPVAAGGLAWGWAGGALLGVAAGAVLAAFVAADWGLLAALPRRGLSFGPYQPPLLALAVARCLAALAVLPAHSTNPAALALLAVVQALGLGLAAYGLLVEPFRLGVTRQTLHIAKLANPGRPIRVVHLSDLHVERLTRRERSLPALIAGLSPDLILISGDYQNASYCQDPQALADLDALLTQLHAPGGVYGCLGTIEVDLPDVLRPVVSGAGVVLLEDRAVELYVAGHRLWLAGINCTRDPKADGARLRELLAGAPPGVATIVLHHMPDLLPEAAALGVDLLLAGHTHGGQWRVPGFGAILTNSRYGKRYEGGLYRRGQTHLYVSRGLGMEGFGTPRARLFCPPEVVTLTLAG